MCYDVMQNMKVIQPLYLGTKAHVACIDMLTGEEVWRTKIKSSSVISVVVEKGIVVAHARGSLFGLDKSSGVILWTNGLAGLGYGYCFMTTESSSTSSNLHNTVADIDDSSDTGGDD